MGRARRSTRSARKFNRVICRECGLGFVNWISYLRKSMNKVNSWGYWFRRTKLLDETEFKLYCAPFLSVIFVAFVSSIHYIQINYMYSARDFNPRVSRPHISSHHPIENVSPSHRYLIPLSSQRVNTSPLAVPRLHHILHPPDPEILKTPYPIQFGVSSLALPISRHI